MVEVAKDAADVLAVTVTVSTLASWLPPTASVLTIAWLAIRIWESDTIQKLRNARVKKHK
jgi:hypothetical protein